MGVCRPCNRTHLRGCLAAFYMDGLKLAGCLTDMGWSQSVILPEILDQLIAVRAQRNVQAQSPLTYLGLPKFRPADPFNNIHNKVWIVL